ncbi:hypothetical protein GGR50DRAFT_652728 [Xylaria sp. CBS 124048]|nr:hypothetical protein GGR50DRAFT_652728 [Xylaria sp. CBS 124048]
MALFLCLCGQIPTTLPLCSVNAAVADMIYIFCKAMMGGNSPWKCHNGSSLRRRKPNRTLVIAGESFEFVHVTVSLYKV